MPETHNRPGAELLLCCARVVPDDSATARMKSLAGAVKDWQSVLRFASRHRVKPLLCAKLRSHCPDLVPDAVMSELREHFEQNTQRNLLLAGELIRLQRWFTSEGISIISYKGPVLASEVYGNLALRQFFDLDVLLRRDDVQRAKKLLLASNFRQHPELTAAQERRFLKSDCEYAFRREDGLEVEVHWGITPRYFSCSLDLARIWQRSGTVSLGGVSVPTLSREDLLLVLCVHGAKHLWSQLGWICDVSELIRVSPAIDWQWVERDARAAGCERILWLGLSLATKLLGSILPNEIAAKIGSDNRVKALASEVRESMFHAARAEPDIFERSPDQPFHTRVLFHPFHLKVRERWRDRIAYCTRLAFTPGAADWEAVRLPSAFFLLYYLIRPVRLAGKYLARCLRRYRSQDPT